MRLMRFVRSDDVGAVAVITAIVSLVLFGVAALTVDIGRMWVARRQSQSDADLAALAGALYLPKDAPKACRTALQYLRDNMPGGAAPSSGIDPDSACTATGTADNQILITNNKTRITVNTPRRTINFGLAQAIGFSQGHENATATAEIRSPKIGIEPFFLSSTEVAGLSCLKDDNSGGGPVPEAVRASLLIPSAVTINSISPPQGYIAGGDTVTLSGAGFTATRNVVWDGKTLGNKNVQYDAATGHIIVTTPAHAAARINVVVQNGTGKNIDKSAPVQFTYIDPALTLSPATGTSLGGTPVNVTGSFPANSNISWGGTPLVPVSASAGRISVITPPQVGNNATVPVLVTNPLMSNIQWTGSFTYSAAVYTLTLTPAFGSVAGGYQVVLSEVGGPAFTGASQVSWNGQNIASTFSKQTGNLTVTVPAYTSGPLAVPVTVTTGTATTQPATFTYTKQSIVLTPNVGPTAGGNTVVISTTDAPPFDSTSTVTWNGNTISSTLNKDGTLSVTAPPQGAGPATVFVTVTTKGQQSLPSDYTYQDAVVANDCTQSTGDFGYLDLPRDDSNTPELTYNAMLGMENTGRVINTLPADGTCPADDPNQDMILDTPPTGQVPLKPVVTCLNILTGGKVSQVADGLIQGKGGQPGRLQAVHDNQTRTNILGTNIDGDSIAKYLTNGMTESQFAAALSGNLSSLTAVISPDIVNCPRFSYVPVLDTPTNPQNANNYWAIKDFMGSFIKKFDLNNGGTQVTVIEAYVFPLSLLPPSVPSPDGTIDFIGSGPIVPVLIK
jgi:hypothetical protein